MTLEELLQYDYFKGLKLIAGENGLGNNLRGSGILDYELDKDVSGKYAHRNFLPGQLVISSLLFAKNNPFILNDIVKYLVEKKVSGLIIKNVFQIPIHDFIIRYADSKNFPILIADKKNIFFEEFVINVHEIIKASENNKIAESYITSLLYSPMDKQKRIDLANRLIPTNRNQYICSYFRFNSEKKLGVFLDLVQKDMEYFEDFPMYLYRYGNGFFIIISQDNIDIKSDIFNSFFINFHKKFPNSFTGLSKIHYLHEELNEALLEAAYAAAVMKIDGNYPIRSSEKYVSFEDIGIYKILIPLTENGNFKKYESNILEKIFEYDAKNKSQLMNTLINLIKCKGNLKDLSKKLSQHENTLRYRLKIIKYITGLNYRILSDYEQLAIACRMYMLSDIKLF